MDPLLLAFAQRLGQAPEATRPALDALLADLRTTLDHDGEARLDGVGTFLATGGAIGFAPDPALRMAVNRPYAGLVPIMGHGPAQVAAETVQALEPEAEASEPEREGAAPEASALVPPTEVVEAYVEAHEETHEETRTPEEADLLPGVYDATPDAELPEAEPDSALTPDTSSAEPVMYLDVDEPPQELAAPEVSSEPTPLEQPPAAEPPTEADKAELDAPPTAASPLEAPPTAPADPPPGAGPESDEEWETALADVWAPADPPAPDHPLALGGDGEPPIEYAEYSVVEEHASGDGAGSAEAPAPTEEMLAAPSAPTPDAEPPSDPLADPFGDAAGRPGWTSSPRSAPPQEAASEAPPPALVAPPPLAEPSAPEQPAPPPLAGSAEPPPYRVPTPADGLRDRVIAAERPQRRSLLVPLGLILIVIGIVAAVMISLNGPRVRRALGVPDVPADASERGATGATAYPGGVPTQAAPAATGDTTPNPTGSAPPVRPEAPAAGRVATPPRTPAPGPGSGAPASPPAAIGSGADASAPSLPDEGGVTWVVGSTTAAEARQQAERYRREGFTADVIPARVGRRTVYRVTVGRYRTEAEALQARPTLPDDIPADAWIYQLGQ